MQSNQRLEEPVAVGGVVGCARCWGVGVPEARMIGISMYPTVGLFDLLLDFLMLKVLLFDRKYRFR